MRIELVNPLPAFACICVGGNHTMQSDKERVYADLDGRPFKDYYCEVHRPDRVKVTR